MIAIFIHVDGHFTFLSPHFKNKGRSVRVSSSVVDFVYIIIVLLITVLFVCHNSFKVMTERLGISLYLLLFIC